MAPSDRQRIGHPDLPDLLDLLLVPAFFVTEGRVWPGPFPAPLVNSYGYRLLFLFCVVWFLEMMINAAPGSDSDAVGKPLPLVPAGRDELCRASSYSSVPPKH